MARSTQQLRELYKPPCQVTNRVGALEAWQAFDEWLRAFDYAARPGDTAFRNCRRITGGTGYSLHAYFFNGVIAFWNWVRDGLGRSIGIGLACDVNWRSNPYGPRLVTDMPRAMVDGICAIRTNSGAVVFRSGVYYSGNKDPMHYEIVASPAELATGIDLATLPRRINDDPMTREEEEMLYWYNVEGISAVFLTNGLETRTLTPEAFGHLKNLGRIRQIQDGPIPLELHRWWQQNTAGANVPND